MYLDKKKINKAIGPQMKPERPNKDPEEVNLDLDIENND